METLRDVLIAADEIDRYFGSRAQVTLWRAKRVGPTTHLFSLIEQPVTRPGGKVRPADITIEMGPEWPGVGPRTLLPVVACNRNHSGSQSSATSSYSLQLSGYARNEHEPRVV